MADLPFECRQELTLTIRRIRQALLNSYGPTIMFEHGIRGEASGGCGVDHAHLHLVPFTNQNDPFDLLKTNHSFEATASISEYEFKVAADLPYLYYEQANGDAWISKIAHLPSQYLRKIVAERVGITSWDWRETNREERLIQTLSKLSDQFAKPFTTAAAG